MKPPLKGPGRVWPFAKHQESGRVDDRDDRPGWGDPVGSTSASLRKSLASISIRKPISALLGRLVCRCRERERYPELLQCRCVGDAAIARRRSQSIINMLRWVRLWDVLRLALYDLNGCRDRLDARPSPWNRARTGSRYAIALSAVLTNGTREFFGSKLEKALQGIETGQLIQWPGAVRPHQNQWLGSYPVRSRSWQQRPSRWRQQCHALNRQRMRDQPRK